jgi:chlorobactene glucosyltransferase
MLQILWIQYQIDILIFLAVILAIVLSNSRILRNLGDHPIPQNLPNISVLIPARNEENNIGQCVLSILGQDYPNFRVFALDDNSTDGTWRILSQLSASDPRLHVLKGKPLPAGWFGKHWACHQLTQAADGELILFTDADTRHHPKALSDAVAAINAMDADFLTAFPREETASLGECLVVSLFPWFIIGFLPLYLAYRWRMPAMSAAIGQFMLFRREAFEEIGGYEAIRHEAVDDVALARKIKIHGLKWRMINGTNRISCRMYHSFREAYRGFTKNLFAGFGYRVLRFVLVWLWIVLAFLSPIIILIMGISMSNIPQYSMILAGIDVIFSLLIWGVSHWRFRFPFYLTFLYPISVILMLIIALGSMVLTITGRANWKGRTFMKPKLKWL